MSWPSSPQSPVNARRCWKSSTPMSRPCWPKMAAFPTRRQSMQRAQDRSRPLQVSTPLSLSKNGPALRLSPRMAPLRT
ncbi:UNVERIFIED_CONTAM: hypothetical protein GTU68_009510 [Idotea baltica]|nr:hypothetical protein [Idotea baltica]